ncbi:hypothetical protein D8674_009744 [Pyrus ussuriensis x Pyrus communis]|uniref:Uncharacterized protein n=1 Tax=Pyrus ussuriensis x Pyrus communis TaxID=2448454 RepID=A0A5N5F9L8_9ROSA|nr:hypothetical protein D8674_009744 [Pyrus ussuriensis x Pyrus communis]
MKFVDWYLKIAFGSALIGVFHDRGRLLLTVLESEKQAWENSPEAQAIRDQSLEKPRCRSKQGILSRMAACSQGRR